jgi:hypothetical protein
MEVAAEVEQWLAKYLGSQFPAIDRDDILGSLRYAGEDADELLDAFAQEFSVDMSDFNPWHHYVADEPPIFRRFRPVSDSGQSLEDLPISLTDLANAAQTGKWAVDYTGRELRYHNPMFSLPGLILIGVAIVLLLGFLRTLV